jgi:acetylornithine deacetylase/succinyl-diaminopimelate desuccinylase-like protein
MALASTSSRSAAPRSLRARQSDGSASANNIASDPRVASALQMLAQSADEITDEQARITEIPAPPFGEATRGAYLKKLLTAAGLRVHIDSVGNVIAERSGTAAGTAAAPGSARSSAASGSDAAGVVLVTAHLDTVFPAGTNVAVKREGARLLAPGISDNGTGLATIVTVARVLRDAKIPTRDTILLVADVGEEGEGNLRGVRALVEEYRSRLRAVIALDGAATDYVATAALPSRRFDVIVTGPGGHSWSDFGVPNPIDALGRAIAKLAETEVPTTPRTTFNVGRIEGGTSVNAIPERASMSVDLRSESDAELARLERELRADVQAAVNDEMAAARARGMAATPLAVEINLVGSRPGGELPDNSPLLAALDNADSALGNHSRHERVSTDANIPLSLGIPAISIGCGGAAGGAHTTEEWYDPTGRAMGLQRVLLTVIGAAGLAP